MTEIVLNVGDVLYLPAGWFHEVLSETTEANNGHMAFNYWFHPPDGNSFKEPYTSTFWQKDWKDRNIGYLENGRVSLGFLKESPGSRSECSFLLG